MPEPLDTASMMEQPLAQKKYKRVWKRGEVKKLYDLAQNYASGCGKSLEQLDPNDYSLIAHSIGHTPNQCMKKLLEIQANGTLRPGVWSDTEDEELKNLIVEKN
jgi:hypothetical protein